MSTSSLLENNEEIRISVLTNLLTMLLNRKWIVKNTFETLLGEFSKDNNDNNIYKITLDVDLINLDTYLPIRNEEINKLKHRNIIYVKLYFYDITSKVTQIYDFLNQYEEYHKILIVDSIVPKSKQSIITEYLHTEIFTKNYLKQDLLSIDVSPQYEPLSNQDKDLVMKEYDATKRTMPKILFNDPASLYFYLQKEQLVRIIRHSEVSTQAIFYRIVI